MSLLSDVLIGIFLGWILSLFDFDNVFIKSINELFGLKVTNATYYSIEREDPFL